MIRNLRCAFSSWNKSKFTRINSHTRNILQSNNCLLTHARSKKSENLFRPVPIKASEDDINVGAELTGSVINKTELLKILNKFSQKREIRLLCMENGLDGK